MLELLLLILQFKNGLRRMERGVPGATGGKESERRARETGEEKERR